MHLSEAAENPGRRGKIIGSERMRDRKERTGPLFSCMSAEARFPNDHPLQQVRKLANQALDRLNPTFCRPYPERKTLQYPQSTRSWP